MSNTSKGSKQSADVNGVSDRKRGIPRRNFLQLGTGVAVLAVGSACSSVDTFGVLKKKILLSEIGTRYPDDVGQSLVEPDPSNLHHVIERIGTDEIELVIDQATSLEDSSDTAQDVTIPANVEVIVNREGSINLNNKTLSVLGSFKAGSFKVFELGADSSTTLTNPSGATPTSVTGSTRDVFLANGAGVNPQNLVVFGAASQLAALPFVDASWFGLTSDGTRLPADYSTGGTDNWEPLQRAINSARFVRHVKIPIGNYLVGDTLHLKTHNSTFNGIVLEGGGGIGLGNRTSLMFDENVKDRPLLDVEYARGTVIRRLSLFGTNYKPVENVAVPNSYHPTPDLWITQDGGSPSGPVYTNGRYNPYCAISTEAFAGKALENIEMSSYTGKPTGWSGADYYPTDSAKGRTYDKRNYYDNQLLTHSTGSAEVLIEEVFIDGFVAGIAVSPSGSLQNDTLRVIRSRIKACVYGISIGTSQARACHFKENNISACYAAIDNLAYGEQRGSLFTCTTNQYATCRMLYKVITPSQGNASMVGEYAENFLKIGAFGNIGASGSGRPVVLNGCSFHFAEKDSMRLMLAQSTMVLFQGCHFGFPTTSREIFLMPYVSGAGFVFDSCRFSANSFSGSSLPVIHSGFIPGGDSFEVQRNNIIFRDCILRNNVLGSDAPLSSEQYVRKTGISREQVHPYTRKLRVKDETDGYKEKLFLLQHRILEYIGLYVGLPFSAISSYARDGSDVHKVTFTPTHKESFMQPSAGEFDCKKYRVFMLVKPKEDNPSELFVWLPVGKVTEYEDTGTAGQVTVEVVEKYKYEIEEVHAGPLIFLPWLHTAQFSTDDEPSELSLHCILGGEVTGDLTAASTSVTGVTNASLLKVGDFIGEYDTTHFEPETRVKSISGTTVTLTRAAKVSATGVTIPQLITLKEL